MYAEYTQPQLTFLALVPFCRRTFKYPPCIEMVCWIHNSTLLNLCLIKQWWDIFGFSLGFFEAYFYESESCNLCRKDNKRYFQSSTRFRWKTTISSSSLLLRNRFKGYLGQLDMRYSQQDEIILSTANNNFKPF